MNFARRRLVALVAALTAGFAVPAVGQLVPSAKPITLVVSYAPGGGADAVARMVASKLQERLGHAVVVENRPGGGGSVAVTSVVRAAPDGHTVLLLDSSSVVQKWLNKSVTYEVMEDLTPVAQIVSAPLALFASPEFEANTPAEVVALAKEKPSSVFIGTPGVGTPHHMAVLLLNSLAGIDIQHVSYRGSSQALTDLLGGRVPMVWAVPTAAMAHVATGKVKIIGVASAKPSAVLPNVPTIARSTGLDFNLEPWYGIAVPKGTPAAFTARLAQELQVIMASAEVREGLQKQGLESSFIQTDAFKNKIKTEYTTLGALIRNAGIKPE